MQGQLKTTKSTIETNWLSHLNLISKEKEGGGGKKRRKRRRRKKMIINRNKKSSKLLGWREEE